MIFIITEHLISLIFSLFKIVHPLIVILYSLFLFNEITKLGRKYYRNFSQNYWKNFFNLCFNITYFFCQIGLCIFVIYVAFRFILPTKPIWIEWLIFTILFISSLLIISKIITIYYTDIKKKREH